ncbi:centrosome-associated zinc finger protein CP190 [Diachasma alloeum]|uniref:centrosome-associated zinc finger protein CP190 n=1 Tax=Diachasma alloeum TaxID=454923 RepID=UPI0007382293|nr:centrosome-associated zinc finger protein CP190 [Diachasma alloeum]XP_015119874.1 centrosome-associated zinc finger protein CP190 [Diachasma alloeum]XP_015119882.1 centrosome-associated zinc finger protein CP190 [Diachasma alloeum]
MQSTNVKQVQAPGLKQVKVDNWGTFFLQRLQQLYVEEELLDLTIKFPTSDITVQAHRLVITTCTDYFMQLERKQREQQGDFDGVLIMPSDMPYECVKSIISFMYTGQLEYWTSEQNALYRTAQKMNMTVLTKLLDAQFNTTALQTSSPPSPDKSNISFHKPSSPKKSSMQSLSMTPLPGRKLPIWRRKLESKPEVTAGPSRFELPDAEDLTLGVFSSFDDITYNTKPIVKATDHSTPPEEPSFNRSTSDMAKNDTTEDEDEDDPRKSENSDDEWTPPNSRSEEIQPTPSKRVRFELEEKENLEKPENNPVDNINNHAKIIREVLKKYPHLVKNNKNIRLKIMQKESKTAESAAGKTKVSYVVLKSDHLMSADEKDERVLLAEGESGPWKCHKCDIDEEYPTYYMYRRHMQDVHEEKFDPRVCEHCGYKATKRNILMHHMYVKHNVPPPKSMSFPKCHACNYVGLSDTLLARHQKSHNHGPRSLLNSQTDEVECVQCSETFKDVSELASHEMSTGHGTSVPTVNGDKGYKCSLCPKVFIKPVNLQVHVESAHKEREVAEVGPGIPLEPSSEAEALSHVASGIAASLGVAEGLDQEQQDEQVITSEGNYLVNEMVLNNMQQQENYNGHEIEDQQMIMLIDNENYQQDEGQPSQSQPQQLEISSNEQLVMQGTDEGMIVYIHGNEDQSARQVYESFQQEVSQETEEIVEEVEEVEEVVEEVEEMQEGEQGTEHIEEVIQYVEEETEIVEYEEHQGQESMMIIEEEHLEPETDKQKETRELADEWDEDSTDMNES